MTLTREEKHELMVAIGKALDSGNDIMVTVLGTQLKMNEQNNIRYVKEITDYETALVENKLSKITKTVYAVCFKGFEYLTTQAEVAKRNYLTINQARRIVTNQTDSKTVYRPVGEVLESTLLTPVETYTSNGSYKGVETYLDVCISKGIHVEDLEDLIFDGTADKNGFKYKFVGGE